MYGRRGGSSRLSGRSISHSFNTVACLGNVSRGRRSILNPLAPSAACPGGCMPLKTCARLSVLWSLTWNAFDPAHGTLDFPLLSC